MKKRNSKKFGRRIGSYLLCAALVMSSILIPEKQVGAEETQIWTAPAVKQINFGTAGIIDPAVPGSANDEWEGCYVWYGKYGIDDTYYPEESEEPEEPEKKEELQEIPVKYRVLDAVTTEYSKDGTTQTMLLDCDSVLYSALFDEDGIANESDESVDDWAISDVKKSLNGKDFWDKAGAFMSAEKNAVAASTVEGYAIVGGEEEAEDEEKVMIYAGNYVALNEDKIFLLDEEEIFNGAYGYIRTDKNCACRKKGEETAYWWLRSDFRKSEVNGNKVLYICPDGSISYGLVNRLALGVSPAFNLNLSSVLFSSACGVSKSSALTSVSDEIGMTTNNEWKLTLKDDGKSVSVTEGRYITKTGDGTITVPYTYSDLENASDCEKVNQISVMITDKKYVSGNAENAQILYYGALQNIKDAEGKDSTVESSVTGTGTFELPSGLYGTMGEDYHVYLLAEHVSEDNAITTEVDESLYTDYAGEPLEIEIKNAIETVSLPGVATPVPEQLLAKEMAVSCNGVAEKATLTWKKENTEVSGNAEWKTTYQVYVTLTAMEGYAFLDTTEATISGDSVDGETITLNSDGTLSLYGGEFTTATRKITGVTAPEVPVRLEQYYTTENVLTSEELNEPACVTLEGTTQPNTLEMKVEWQVVDAEGNSAIYDAAPLETNIFKWTVKASEYAGYDIDNVSLEGTVAVQNKRHTPKISVLPTVSEQVYNPSRPLTDADLTGGVVKGKEGTALAGTWSWKKQGLIPSVADSEKTQYEILFTPADAEHYAPVAATVTVKVRKATPVIAEKPVAGRLPSGKTLKNAALSGGKVQMSASDATEVKGTFAWSNPAKKPSVADSGKTQYEVVFYPADTTNYNSVKTTVPVVLAAPEKGAIAKSGKATYKVTKSALKNGTAAYIAPANKKATTVIIPDTVKIDGVTFKVTAIEKNAFKNNKKVKKVTVGKNVTSIGKNAFYGCSKLKTLKIKTTKLTTKKIGSKAFGKTPKSIKVTVPKKKFKTYKSMLIKKGIYKKAKFRKG